MKKVVCLILCKGDVSVVMETKYLRGVINRQATDIVKVALEKENIQM